MKAERKNSQKPSGRSILQPRQTGHSPEIMRILINPSHRWRGWE